MEEKVLIRYGLIFRFCLDHVYLSQYNFLCGYPANRQTKSKVPLFRQTFEFDEQESLADAPVEKAKNANYVLRVVL